MAVYTYVVLRSHWVRSTKNDVRFILRLMLALGVLISLTVGIGFCVRGEQYIEPTPVRHSVFLSFVRKHDILYSTGVG